MNIRTTSKTAFPGYTASKHSANEMKSSEVSSDLPLDQVTLSNSEELTGLYRLGAAVAVGGTAIGLFQGNLGQVAGSLASGIAIMVYAKN